MTEEVQLDQLSDQFQVEVLNIMEYRTKIDISLKKMILIFQQVQEISFPISSENNLKKESVDEM